MMFRQCVLCGRHIPDTKRSDWCRVCFEGWYDPDYTGLDDETKARLNAIMDHGANKQPPVVPGEFIREYSLAKFPVYVDEADTMRKYEKARSHRP